MRYLTGDDEGNLWFIGGNFQQLPSLVRFTPADQSTEIIHRNFDHSIPLDDLSKPRPIEFTTEDGTIAHALFFPPSNRNYTGPSDERPPLIVVSHGGPTSAAKTYLQFEWQYWTSRGFALADVNYGGSTGYGRSYRERLKGTWGELEPLDCIHAARYLIDEGQVDGNRLIIRGGSAGGWTTLCVLTFHDFFTAGVSYYGVADAEALMKFTHKFEERYLDSLLGPYPERKELYTARSPIHHTHQLSCPVILFQGLDDKIVPPSQSEMMVHALESNNIPHAYIAFEGEAHGFRRADTIQRALEAELSFFSQIYGIKLEEKVPHLTIINL
jgi:dipeptidyl aminopeptidase/acylaminoacyl peptidase